MASILKNTYATQDIISNRDIELRTYPDLMISDLIEERIGDMDGAARRAGDKVDWGTLAITTRWDVLLDGLAVSCRVNPL